MRYAWQLHLPRHVIPHNMYLGARGTSIETTEYLIVLFYFFSFFLLARKDKTVN